MHHCPGRERWPLKRLTAVQLRARQARLGQLGQGLNKERGLIRLLQGQGPLTDGEALDYLGALQAAAVAVAAAESVMEGAARRAALKEASYADRRSARKR
jgi:hypothetical protein